MKRRTWIWTIAALVMLLAGCGGGYYSAGPDFGKDVDYSRGNNPIATIQMRDENNMLENGGKIVIELYPQAAPNTVANFISLANDGFYDGLTFHRVIEGFMIQGGDPLANGLGGPGYSIKGEFAANGFEQNQLKHERGVISMARADNPDSAGSQFFILVEDRPHLDGNYAGFGKVIEGMELVDYIASLPNDPRDKPYEDQIIESIRVDTRGVDYGEPEKLEDHLKR